MPRLTPAQRERAVGRLQAGDTPEAVAMTFNCHIATVYRLQHRFLATGTTADRHRSGRPLVTTPRQDRYIFRHHVQDRFRTAAETARNVIGGQQAPISADTVRRRLANRGLRNHRPARGPMLTVRAFSGHRTTSTGLTYSGSVCCSLMRAASVLTTWMGVCECGGDKENGMQTAASKSTTPGADLARSCGAP